MDNAAGTTEGKARPPVGDASLRSATSSKANDTRPAWDLFVLGEKISLRSGTTKNAITPAAVQGWVNRYGHEVVGSALRTIWGFPPETPIRNPYAYVDAILKGES